MKKIILIVVALAFSLPAMGQGVLEAPAAPPANMRPPGLKHVGIEQHLDEQVPLNLAFKDETGKNVQLGDYFGKRPVILSLVYYRCPMLCGQLLEGLESALRVIDFDPGKQFDVITVSFDPSDTPAIAAAKKAEIMARYKRSGAAGGWHFLTGPQASIDALTKAVGFEYEYNQKTDQFAHATAIMVLTPGGKLTQYYYGIDFPPKDLRLGLIQASKNKIGTVVDQVLLYCYHYDPDAGRYSALIGRVLQVAGGLTVLVLGGFILVMFRLDSKVKNRNA
ncbi:MAG TPA: SCO family protein [Terriglobales bacterium]|nr:SCO family protein [Terriglobales bacterium]